MASSAGNYMIFGATVLNTQYEIELLMRSHVHIAFSCHCAQWQHMTNKHCINLIGMFPFVPLEGAAENNNNWQLQRDILK